MHMAEENYRVLTHLDKSFLDINGYADDTTLLQNQRGTKEPFDDVKEENENAGLKHNIQKLRSWQPVPSLHDK